MDFIQWCILLWFDWYDHQCYHRDAYLPPEWVA